VLTNDGHAILREIDVNHPAAKVNGEGGCRWREREEGQQEKSGGGAEGRAGELTVFPGVLANNLTERGGGTAGDIGGGAEGRGEGRAGERRQPPSSQGEGQGGC